MGITSSVYVPPKGLFSSLAGTPKKQKFVVQTGAPLLLTKSKHIGDLPYSLTAKTLVDGEDLVNLLEQNLEKFSNELKKLIEDGRVMDYIFAASDLSEDDVGEGRYKRSAELAEKLRDSMSNPLVVEYLKVLGNEKATEVLLEKVRRYVTKAPAPQASETVDAKPSFDPAF